MAPEISDKGLENLTRDIGREIFARLNGSASWLFTPAWWDDRLMEWTMADPAVKVQLFRFIDALPLLRTPASITRHLREYLTEARDHLPPWLRWGLPWLPANGWSGRLLRLRQPLSRPPWLSRAPTGVRYRGSSVRVS